MRRLALILLIASIVTAGCASANQSATVTYIANAGFLIESGESKVLIDALFNDRTIDYAHVPSQAIQGKMAAAEFPFDDVDLILVTHGHRDHFRAGLMAEFLASSRSTILLAPPQAVDMLPEADRFGERVRSLLPDLHHYETIAVGDIKVKAYHLKHSAYMETDPVTGKERDRHEAIQNLVYVVDAGGFSFLHTGDTVFSQSLELFEGNLFEKVDLDLVFMEYFDWSEETAQVLKDWMTPDHIVFMHLPPEPDKIEELDAHLKEKFPQAVLFRKPMEIRTF